MNQTTCPICGELVKDDEVLLAYYYPPKDWWVVQHMIPDEFEAVCNGERLTILNRRTKCGQANYDAPQPKRLKKD